MQSETVGALYVGGTWSDDANAGLWNWNGNNSPSNANPNLGGRIGCMVSLLRDCISPRPLGQKLPIKSAV